MPACILTVDDENTITIALELLLRDHGYEVSSASNAAEAEALLARRWFDLVFLDLRLPDSDGIVLLEHIKRVAPETEVVIMTAHGSLDVTIEAIKRGAFYYLEKPFTFEQILCDQVTMIRLSSLEKQVEVVKFPGGQNAPGAADVPAASADAFVPAPDPGAMVIANPSDKMIYYYTEGMAAPMGDFQNYQRAPRAVKIVDRSLREESAGVYTTTARLPKHGTYTVSLLLDSPRVVHCFEAVAAMNPTLKDDNQPSLLIEYLHKEAPLTPGADYKIRFRLTDAASRKPNSDLKDVDVLVFLSPGIWQQRQRAKANGDGVYEVTVNVPETGVYFVFVETPSQHVQYRQLQYLTLQAKDKVAAN